MSINIVNIFLLTIQSKTFISLLISSISKFSVSIVVFRRRRRCVETRIINFAKNFRQRLLQQFFFHDVDVIQHLKKFFQLICRSKFYDQFFTIKFDVSFFITSSTTRLFNKTRFHTINETTTFFVFVSKNDESWFFFVFFFWIFFSFFHFFSFDFIVINLHCRFFFNFLIVVKNFFVFWKHCIVCKNFSLSIRKFFSTIFSSKNWFLTIF